MTSEIPNARQMASHLSYAVEPQTETRIPGTPFIVWHDGDRAANVDVMVDGAIELWRGDTWIVRTAL